MTTTQQAAGAAPADLLNYLKNLTISTFNRHYAIDAHYVSGESKWEPCDDMAGLLSQLDNMLTGLTRSVPAAPDTVPAAYPAFPGKEVPSYSHDRLRMVRDSEMRAYVDADRAARTQPVAEPLTGEQKDKLRTRLKIILTQINCIEHKYGTGGARYETVQEQLEAIVKEHGLEKLPPFEKTLPITWVRDSKVIEPRDERSPYFDIGQERSTS